MDHKRNAFTLVELLVVIGIIALLISILLPSLARAREQAKFVQCQSNLRQINQAIMMYVAENDGYFPRPQVGRWTWNGQDPARSWPQWFYSGDDQGSWGPVASIPQEDRPLARYLKGDLQVHRCPNDDAAEAGEAYWDALTTSYPMNAYIQSSRITQCRQSTITMTVIEPAVYTIFDPRLELFWLNPVWWWHPNGLKTHSTNMGFADGHVAFTPLQYGLLDTPEYRHNP